MSVDCLAVPPLPVLEFWRRRPGRSRPRAHPRIFPKALEDELSRIARDAVRAGIDPVVGAPAGLSGDEARILLERSFRAFLEERNRIWPPILRLLKENWLVLFPLLREAAGLVRHEKMKVPIPDVADEGPGARSLVRFGLALRTYELTLHLAIGSMTRVLDGLASGRTPEGLEDSEKARELLNRIDVATAALEFGTIAAVRLLERRGGVDSRVFEGATEYAARGADEQHVLLRGVLRSILGEEPAAVAEGDAFGGTGLDAPPEALLADWVKAVLAV